MATAYIPKHGGSKWAHRKDWVLDGVSGTIKEHAKRLGETYQRTRILIKTGAFPLTRKELGQLRSKPKPKPKKICQRCGSEISGSGRKWCSQECENPVFFDSCLTCGTAFKRCGGKKYCGEACRPSKPIPSKPILSKVCPHCRAPFETKNKSKKFCRVQCGKKSAKKREHERRRKPAGWDITHEPAMCFRCQKRPLKVPRHITKRLCRKCANGDSPQCRKAAQKRAKRYLARRRLKDPGFRAREAMRYRLREVLRKRGLAKKTSLTVYLGVTASEFGKILEEKWLDGMSWANYGPKGWHVDHLIPCSMFDLSREDHRHVCFHHSNLRPLWHMDNVMKSNKLVGGIPDELKAKALAVGILVL